MGAAKELCEAGGLYTILPACAVEREVDLARLATRPVVEPDLVRDLSIVTTTARPLSPAARAVARQAIETARALVATRRWHATV
jgi:DNA-binding transcriptional LysR family regulator